MLTTEMDKLVADHLDAEAAGDPDGTVAMYADDVEHDIVGAPAGPLRGRDTARSFYDQFMKDVRTETMVPTHRYYGDDFCVIEHDWTGTVPGTFLGIPGNGRRITFRLLHIWEFRDNKITRENVWLDAGTAIAQLTAPHTTEDRP